MLFFFTYFLELQYHVVISYLDVHFDTAFIGFIYHVVISYIVHFEIPLYTHVLYNVVKHFTYILLLVISLDMSAFTGMLEDSIFWLYHVVSPYTDWLYDVVFFSLTYSTDINIDTYFFYIHHHLIVFLFLTIGICLILLGVCFIISDQNLYFDKVHGYECGFDPFSDARDKFYIKFYLVSILFLLFDVEIVFFLP